MSEEKSTEKSTKKTTRTTHIQDRSRERKKRLGPKLNEDTLQMQERYVEDGYLNISEILFLIANDTYEDMVSTAKEKGINSEEYNNKVNIAIKAASQAAPYFAKAIKSNVEITNNLDNNSVEDALTKLLNKK